MTIPVCRGHLRSWSGRHALTPAIQQRWRVRPRLGKSKAITDQPAIADLVWSTRPWSSACRSLTEYERAPIAAMSVRSVPVNGPCPRQGLQAFPGDGTSASDRAPRGAKERCDSIAVRCSRRRTSASRGPRQATSRACSPQGSVRHSGPSLRRRAWPYPRSRFRALRCRTHEVRAQVACQEGQRQRDTPV